ncbi:MAG: adenylyltransferase/cytidyltransferase family protein [Candidatus Undinarchaeales archaeon]|jgi:nicotinamide-nucleotide adenylyltransferase|nr:adenylyltransferase/cytidyltransferase family protein [Candidatus Undinarchaeales archaeon]
MTTGLFIGRFQPFHNGHLHVIKQILKECDKIIIGIGSANSEITEQNPLTSTKRKELIEQVLQSENITNYRIVLINDQETHQLWADEVRKKANPFDTMYVSGDNVRLDFIKSCGFEVKEVDFLDGISATKIRELKKNGQPWQQFVPPIVAKDFS